MRPVVIAVAITGSVPRKKDNPAVPVTPPEQIESTQEAFEAGASLVHIHVRNPTKARPPIPELFAQVQEGIRKHCPGMIVQFSTGGRGRDPSARGSALYLRPDMASLSTGSVNFPTIVYENHTALVEDLAGKMKDNGVRPEIEIFDLSHLHGARRLIDKGLMDERPHVQFVMGVQNAMPAEERCSTSSWRDPPRPSPRHLDGGRDRTASGAGDGMGAGAGRRCGAHRAGGQHPGHEGPAGREQRRAGAGGSRGDLPPRRPTCNAAGSPGSVAPQTRCLSSPRQRGTARDRHEPGSRA